MTDQKEREIEREEEEDCDYYSTHAVILGEISPDLSGDKFN